MKLASEYFNIPVSVVKSSIESKLKLEFNNKEYKFILRTSKMVTTSTAASSIKKFPFGKYKDELIGKCIDLSYMKWLLEKDINDRLRFAIRTRINEIKEENKI